MLRTRKAKGYVLLRGIKVSTRLNAGSSTKDVTAGGSTMPTQSGPPPTTLGPPSTGVDITATTPIVLDSHGYLSLLQHEPMRKQRRNLEETLSNLRRFEHRLWRFARRHKLRLREDYIWTADHKPLPGEARDKGGDADSDSDGGGASGSDAAAADAATAAAAPTGRAAAPSAAGLEMTVLSKASDAGKEAEQKEEKSDSDRKPAPVVVERPSSRAVQGAGRRRTATLAGSAGPGAAAAVDGSARTVRSLSVATGRGRRSTAPVTMDDVHFIVRLGSALK
eukprot:PLAT4443.2.p1 GENE.PLAT4443.2~~PLAT4443.2.p1  ORF type:complete len:279 (-),score=83.36 PLAT4443.2:46-882(-)